MNGNRKDLTGQRFGRLVVIEPVTTGEYRNSVWLCQCDCGNKKIVPTYKLLNGRTYSCGCYRKQSKQVIEELAKVKTENERLKSENHALRQCIKDINIVRLSEKYEQYKKALEEVREITEKYYLSDKKLLATGIEINPYGAIIDIQDKINEVLGD